MAVNLSPVGGVAAQFFTNSGTPLTGGKIFTYAAGTTTPQASYTTSQGNVAWTNPIVLDAAGRVPSGGEIWLTDGLIYKFILKDANDVLIATYDNITGINSNAVAYTNQQEIVTATAGQTVFNLGISYQPGTNSLSVFVDGVNQYGPGAQYSYVETDSNTVTFNAGLHVGAEVKFTTTQQQGAGVVDASQVTYDPPFTGSVPTNVEAKLAQAVSVKDFGAVGDGVTDDTDAIQDAIDAVSAAGGGTVLIPSGTFMVNMLTLGIFLKDNVQVVGTGTGSILKGIPIAGTSNFVYVVSIATCSNAGISNCLIDASRPFGESDQKQWHGIRLDGDTSNILIENNVIKECKGDGIWIVLNPGFTVPPTKALIRGNRISNVNRQDIALVQGTDITLTDNFGTGSLDIESDLSNYINTGHIVSNNQFNQILISPLSGLTGVRNNIVVTGNKCNAMYLWGVNFVQVTGNVVNGLIIVAQSGDVAIVGNFCQGVSQLVANGTFIERLVVRDNTIISSTETKGIWLKDVVNAEISDNLINMSAANAVGIYQANNNAPAAGEVRICNNKINATDDCIQIVSAGLTNTTHSIFGNYLKSSSGESISKDGVSQAGKITVADNDIHSAVFVGTSTAVAFHKNRYYSTAYLKINFNASAASIVLDGERFYGSLPTIEISGNAVSGSVVVRDCAGEDITIGASAINFFNTTATNVLFDNVVSNSATPYTALTATVRTGSLIRITGSATRYGVWYNGTSWIDLA